MASVGLGGPVGFSFATTGFCSAVLVARVWEYVSLESYLRCGISCPIRSSDVFQLHHFYYGLAMILVSISFLAVTKRQRVRWDAALIFGIGAGLCVDEAGLLLLRVPYNDLLSILLLALFGVAIFGGTINAAFRDGPSGYSNGVVDPSRYGRSSLSRSASDHNSRDCRGGFLGLCCGSYHALWKETLSQGLGRTRLTIRTT